MEFKKLEKKFIENNFEILNQWISKFFPNFDIRTYKNGHQFYQIYYNDNLVGFFNIYLLRRIQKFFIVPEYQSQGLGSQAVLKIIQIINLPGIHCYVKKNNRKAISFWLKNNFKITENLGQIIKMELIYSSNP